MAKKRISVNIGADVKKVSKLLKSTENDRSIILRLVKGDFVRELSRVGINLGDYASKDFPMDQIAMEIKGVLMAMLNNNFFEQFKHFFENTSSQSSTSESFEYNWDHSSNTDYKYESHTGTERGTSSSSSTHSYIESSSSFTGLLSKEFEQFLVGPMLSAKVIEVITSQVAKTLTYAKQQVK